MKSCNNCKWQRHQIEVFSSSFSLEEDPKNPSTAQNIDEDEQDIDVYKGKSESDSEYEK